MRQVSIILAGCLFVALAGCSGNPMAMAGTAGKTAFKAVKGAEAEATPIHIESASALGAYKGVRLGQVTTDVPPICTPEVMGKIREGIREGMSHEDVRKKFPGGEKTLDLNILCRFYKGKGLMGGEGRLDWLVTLVDGRSHEQMGVVFIEGVSGSPLEHGAADMAKENTRELVKFLSKYQDK